MIDNVEREWTPLIAAAFNGCTQEVRRHIARGSVNGKTSNGDTPLMYASQEGQEEVIRALLEAGAHVDDENFNGDTALMSASLLGHCGVVRWELFLAAALASLINHKLSQDSATVRCRHQQDQRGQGVFPAMCLLLV